ncbi:phage integrase [Sphingopyxis sp. 22461]|uniref:phage integrase n=1 Tax=Sphingopyxis sp. 22461 TaxID=3453923 RepID=UPI003F861123
MSPPASASPVAAEKIPNTFFRGGVYYGRVKVAGDTLRESLGTGDPVEARKLIKKWLAEKSPNHEYDELTFAQVASSWIEHYQTGYSTKTWRRYRTSLKMLKPFFGDLAWAEVTRSKLTEYMSARKSEGLSNATINRDLAVMSNIFEHAVDQEWAEENLVLKLSKKARREKRLPFTMPTPGMIDATFARMRSTFGEICRFALLTGLRRDEIAQLTWSNVLLDRRQLQLFVTKNRTVRVVTLCEEAYQILCGRNSREGYVFVTRNGGAYKRVSEMWREVQLRAEKKWNEQVVSQLVSHQKFIRFRFHDLRHMFAINYLRDGGNIYHLQIEMGHSTIRQTEEYLQYLTAEEQVAAKGVSQQVSHTTAVSRVAA